MIYRQVHELAPDGFPVAVICRCLGASRSGYYHWHSRGPSARQAADRGVDVHDHRGPHHVVADANVSPG
jgi:hypothetical protein